MTNFSADLSRTSRSGLFQLVVGMTLAFPGVSAQSQTYTLERTFAIDASDSRAVSWGWKPGSRNVQVSFIRRYNARCEAGYGVNFRFDRDIRSLRHGDRFTVSTEKIGGRPSPCGMRRTKAAVKDAKHMPRNHAQKPPGWKTNSNIKVIKYYNDWNRSGTLPLYDTRHGSMSTVVEAKVLNDAAFTALALTAGDNKFFFVYRIHNDNGNSPVSRRQDSTYGLINWKAGWYDNASKTIRITDRTQTRAGQRVVRGVWGRINSADNGGFEFVYSGPCTFKGHFWRRNGRRTAWNGWCAR